MKPREKRSPPPSGGGGAGKPPMGSFARCLTTISIVYDFNNLGAALLARLDTFSVVNRATKSVFMGKRRQSGGPSPSYLSALFVRLFVPTLVAAQNEGEPPTGRADRKAPRRLGAGPFVPSTTDRSGLVARKNASGLHILRAYTLARARLRVAIYIH